VTWPGALSRSAATLAMTASSLRPLCACLPRGQPPLPVARYSAACGFQTSATGANLGFYAARSYSLMKPPIPDDIRFQIFYRKPRRPPILGRLPRKNKAMCSAERGGRRKSREPVTWPIRILPAWATPREHDSGRRSGTPGPVRAINPNGPGITCPRRRGAPARRSPPGPVGSRTSSPGDQRADRRVQHKSAQCCSITQRGSARLL
jgi:hypothetical protein